MKVLFFSSNFQGVRKISALLVCMLFVFVFVISPIKVKAEAFPIPPLWLPMNPYNAQGLQGNYVLLNDDQKKIVNEVIGAVNTVYLGMGGYVLVNPLLGVQATRQFYQEYGSTFLNTFWSQIMGTSRAMTDFVGSTIYKASTYETYEEYEQDTAPSVSVSDHKYFQISPELTIAFKNWYRANGGVEDWQLQTKPFKSDTVYNKANNPSAIVLSQQENYLSQHGNARVRFNYPNYYYTYLNSLATGGFLETFTNIFVNTTDQRIYLCKDNGEILSNDTPNKICYQSHISSSGSFESSSMNSWIFPGNNWFMSYNASSYNTYVDLVKALYNHVGFGTTNPYYWLYFEDFVKHVYVGANWSSKHEIFNIDDLNIGNSTSEYIQNIDDVGYVDINSLIGKIADEVVNLRTVVEESVFVKDGDTAIPYADSLQVAIDKFINQPESGVVIPVDIFGGLTGANGPVSYLWFMTKPLVSYTGDLLGLLTLDGDGTFQFTGLGYIVVGVVTVGIIGGLVTKCLL